MSRSDVAWRSAARFALRFVLVYALLAVPWPGARAAAASCFHRAGEALARLALGDAVRFGPSADPGSAADTEILLRKPGGVVAHVRLESRTLAYLPEAFFTALIVATPSSRRRRAVLWLGGSALLAVFVALRVAIPIALSASNPPQPLWNLAPRWREVLAAAEPALALRSASGFVAALFVWVALVALAGRGGET